MLFWLLGYLDRAAFFAYHGIRSRKTWQQIGTLFNVPDVLAHLAGYGSVGIGTDFVARSRVQTYDRNGANESEKEKLVMKELIWQEVPSEVENRGRGGRGAVYRAPILGGWLVTLTVRNDLSAAASITFVPVPNHEWDGSSLALPKPE